RDEYSLVPVKGIARTSRLTQIARIQDNSVQQPFRQQKFLWKILFPFCEICHQALDFLFLFQESGHGQSHIDPWGDGNAIDASRLSILRLNSSLEPKVLLH